MNIENAHVTQTGFQALAEALKINRVSYTLYTFATRLTMIYR
jgi:hypothetical protein